MKTFLLRMAVLCRRLRRLRGGGAEHLQHAEQLATLMRRANPFASWIERANWMIDVAAWIGRAPEVTRLDPDAWTRIKQQRVRSLLDWLDTERGVQRVVRASVQKTLREAGARELFACAGLARGPAPFSVRFEQFVTRLMPKRLTPYDLPGLLAALFPRPGDADWLLALDAVTLARLWKLCADPSIQHAYRTQLDDALLYLATAVAAAGLDPELALDEQAAIPLQAMPFMVLRRELELFLLAHPEARPEPRGVRMLVALCHAHLDRVVEQLERSGMSLAAALRIQALRAQLARVAVLTDLRNAYGGGECQTSLQRLLADLLAAMPRRASLVRLATGGAVRVARMMVERGAARYEKPPGYGLRAPVWSASIGGMIAAGGAFAQLVLSHAGLAPFFEGVFVAAAYAGCLLLLASLGGVLATSQPVDAGARLAASLTGTKSAHRRRGATRQLGDHARKHATGMLANLLGATVAALVIAAIVSPLTPPQASAAVRGLSLFGPTPLFAAVMGAFIWLACMAGEWADTWFVQHGMGQTLAQHRNTLRVLGPLRAGRFARWLQRRIGLIAASVTLAAFIGMTPAAAHFFGLPFEVRHVVFSTAALAAAIGTLGGAVADSRDVWLALAGIAACWLLNAGVAFILSFEFALRAQGVPARTRRLAMLSLTRAIVTSFSARRRKRQLTLVPPPSKGEREKTEPRANAAASRRNG